MPGDSACRKRGDPVLAQSYGPTSIRDLVSWEDMMELQDKIRARLQGTAEAKKRREELLGEVLETFHQGGSKAVTTALNRRLDEMERELNKKLDAVREKL
jgi:hypothetical protein